MRKLGIAGASIVAISSAACTPASQEPAATMRNPASVYCVEQGGRLEIRRETAGNIGYCHLPDGRIIEEWALFRASQDQP